MTVAALCAAALLAVTAVAPALAAPSGDAILTAAQKAVARATYPVYASYRVDVGFSNGAQRVNDSWQSIEDIRAATVIASLFSAQENANPAAPHGINVDLPVFGIMNPAEQRDPIGNVAFAIDQTFGVAPSRTYISGNALNGPAPTPAPRTFRVVGGAVGPDKLYAVQYIETVPGDHGSDYHLKLRPLVDPARDRLRELWIATDTMAVDAAIVAGIGDRAPLTKIAWKVSFTMLNGAPYITHEVALAPLDYGTQGILSDVTIDFNDVQLAQEFPTRYAVGQQAPNPVHDP